MSKPRRAALWLANLLVTVVGAWGLLGLIDRLPMNMPYPIDQAIRWSLHITGNDALANSDDMEVLALLLYFVISLIVVGLIVCLINRSVSKQLNRKHDAKDANNVI